MKNVIDSCYDQLKLLDPKATIIIAIASPVLQRSIVVSTNDLNSLGLARLITYDRERAILK